MSLNCTRCEGTGFLNLFQIKEDNFDPDNYIECVLKWIEDPANQPHDVSVCDCCGNGEEWYGVPGEHYNQEDPAGERGPYARNGGLCGCH